MRIQIPNQYFSDLQTIVIVFIPFIFKKYIIYQFFIFYFDKSRKKIINS